MCVDFGPVPLIFVGARMLHDNQPVVGDKVVDKKLKQPTILIDYSGETLFPEIRVALKSTEDHI